MIRAVFLLIFPLLVFGFEYLGSSKDSKIEQIINSNKFIKSEKEYFRKDINSEVIWIKEEFKNDTIEFKEFYFVLFPNLKEIEAYIVKDNKIEFLNSDNSLFYTVITEPKTKNYIYLKINSKLPNYQFNSYNNRFDFLKSILNKLLFEMGIYVVCFMAFVLSFILFMMLKEWSFLFYGLYTLSFMIHTFLNNQLYNYLVLDDSLKSVHSINLSVVVISSLWFVLTFVKFFEYKPKRKPFFIILSILITVALLVAPFVDIATSMLIDLIVFIPTYAFIPLILFLSRKKEPLAKIIMFGWSIVFFIVALNLSWSNGFFQASPYLIFNIMQLGIVFEIFIFAIALGLQLKYKNDERIEAIQTIYEQKRFATIGKVLAGVEHQWRAPLNYLSSIIVNIQSNLFLQKETSKQNLQNSIDQIQEVVEHMDETMKDFRYFYTQEEKSTFEISKIFIDTFAYFKRYSSTQNIELKTQINTQIQIKSYSGHFRHIFLNFLENSSKIAKQREIKNILITVDISRVDNILICKIEDNAGGTKNIENIFEPFYSESSQSGSGLGLYLVKELVISELKGKIEANNINKGFQIVLKVPYE